MNALKSEVVDINLNGTEVEAILMDYIYAKYPELKDREQWEWEDFSLNFNSKKLEDNALNVIFIRHSDYHVVNEQIELTFPNAKEIQTNG